MCGSSDEDLFASRISDFSLIRFESISKCIIQIPKPKSIAKLHSTYIGYIRIVWCALPKNRVHAVEPTDRD